MSWSIRSCRIDEVHAVFKLLEHGIAPDVESQMAAKLVADPESILVAVESGIVPGAIIDCREYSVFDKIIGTVAFTHDRLYSFMYNLEVAADYRRRGIGKLLVESAIKTLSDRGTAEIGAYAEEGNWKSQSLFRKLEWYEYNSKLKAFGHKPRVESCG